MKSRLYGSGGDLKGQYCICCRGTNKKKRLSAQSIDAYDIVRYQFTIRGAIAIPLSRGIDYLASCWKTTIGWVLPVSNSLSTAHCNFSRTAKTIEKPLITPVRFSLTSPVVPNRISAFYYFRPKSDFVAFGNIPPVTYNLYVLLFPTFGFPTIMSIFSTSLHME